jgi:hypothetical protein
MINKSKFLVFILGGLLISGALVASAFTEPTALPGGTTSYPPLHLGKGIQVRLGRLGIGDSTNIADSAKTSANSLYLEDDGGGDNVTVRQNATLVGNATVLGNFIVGGVLRVPTMTVCHSRVIDSWNSYGGCSGYHSNYTQNHPIFLINAEATTNLGMGTCTRVTNSACPTGTILSKFNSSTGVSSCRYINPDRSPTSLTNC